MPPYRTGEAGLISSACAVVQGSGPGRGKRAAALHAAEAIAAQAQGSGDLDGPDNADTAEWLEDDEQDLPATETGRASFDPVNSPVIKGPRTARKKNSEHLAGTGPLHVFEGLLPVSCMSGISCFKFKQHCGNRRGDLL